VITEIEVRVERLPCAILERGRDLATVHGQCGISCKLILEFQQEMEFI